MKYSQQIGIVAALAVMLSCFLPWIELPNSTLVLNGFNGKVTDKLTFGSQYKGHYFFCVICIVCFAVSKIFAKRFNMFFALLNLSWAIKNFILFRLCRPECPTTKYGLYLLVFFSAIMLVMSLLPKMVVRKEA